MMSRLSILSFVLILELIAATAAAMDRHHQQQGHLPVQLYYTNTHGYQQPHRHRRYASASASASSSSGSGSGSSSFSSSSANSGSFSGGGGGGGGFSFPQGAGYGAEDFNRQFNEFQNYMQQLASAHNNFDVGGAGAVIPNGLDARFGGGNFAPSSGVHDGGFAFPSSSSSFSSPGGDHGASATAHIGPNGGYGQADLHGGLGARFGGGQTSSGGPFPAANNPNAPVGVFTSSSSGSSDINGQKSGFKQATSGVIGADGKVTSYSVRS